MNLFEFARQRPGITTAAASLSIVAAAGVVAPGVPADRAPSGPGAITVLGPTAYPTPPKKVECHIERVAPYGEAPQLGTVAVRATGSPDWSPPDNPLFVQYMFDGKPST